MTPNETKLAELLAIAIEYIDAIADDDSETLQYLKEQFSAITGE